MLENSTQELKGVEKIHTFSFSIFYTQGGPIIPLAGNIRELECTIDIAIILSIYRVILPEDLSKKLLEEIGARKSSHLKNQD